MTDRTDAIVQAIRETGTMTARELSTMFSLSAGHMSRVLNGMAASERIYRSARLDMSGTIQWKVVPENKRYADIVCIEVSRVFAKKDCGCKGCPRPYWGSGFCRFHWHRAKTGKPLNDPIRIKTTLDIERAIIEASGEKSKREIANMVGCSTGLVSRIQSRHGLLTRKGWCIPRHLVNQVPAWVPKTLAERYRAICKSRGEFSAAQWAREEKAKLANDKPASI